MTCAPVPAVNKKEGMVTPLARIAPRATRALVALIAVTASACSDKGAGVILVDSEAKPDRLGATARVLQGQGQASEVGLFLGTPLVVEIKDGAGMPMRGMQAVWTFSSGGGAEAGSVAGQVSQSLTTSTDNQGQTSVTWRLGTQAGVQTASVSISTNSNGKGKAVGVTIEATALAGAATRLTLDPANLTVPVWGMKKIKAIASDRYGNAVAAGQITWSTSDAAIAQVDASGNVTGNAAGHATITALDGTAAAAASVDVTEAAGSSSISIIGGNGQTGAAGQPLPQPLSVRVVDGSGNGVPNASVGWSVTSGDGSVSASTTSTDAQGITSVTWTLGPTTGTQTATATHDGATQQFVATAVSQQPTSPGTVVDLQVVGVTSSTVTLRWTQVDDGAGSAAKYAVRSGSPTLDWIAAAGTQVVIDGTSVGQTIQYTWSNLDAGTAYQFGIAAARDEGGTLVYGTQSNQVSAFTTPSGSSSPESPAAVTDLQVVGMTSSTVSLRWTEVNDGTGKPAKYTIRYGSPTLNWGSAYASEVSVGGTSIGATRTYTVSGLAAGTSYQFGVVAYRGTLNVDAVFGPISNYTSASTSGSSSPEVTSVVAVPSSATITGVGSSRQLSAVAYNAYGNTVSGVTFQWQSLNPSIATVNGSGLVISQALGTALIVVSTTCCTASDTVAVTVQASTSSGPSGAVWEDGFENGLSSSNGYNWGYASSSVFVSSTRARSGTKSLAFRFAGNTDPTADAMSEQRFTFGESLSEVWIEYWVWVPDNYRHRNGDGPDNNKFFFLWDSGNYPGGVRGRLAAMLSAERLADESSRLILMWSSEAELMTTADAPSWSPAISSSTKGRWNQVRIRVKAATGATANNGVFQLWWDGQLRISETALPMFDPDDNKFRNGYLFGWSNSGFDQETTFYLDDFKVYKTSPGW